MMAGELVRANIAALAYHTGLKDDQRSIWSNRDGYLRTGARYVRRTGTLLLMECASSLVFSLRAVLEGMVRVGTL